ncbi:APC family permease [Streptomyces zhihengii]
MTDTLRRSLGMSDAVVVGLGAMIGAGIFAALGPAARAAGSWLPAGLALAGAVAYCNAMSSARLAALHPESGGTYVYGRERLGDVWGWLAGWAFVVGKSASCAAMALTVGVYAWPEQAHAVAVAAVVALTTVNCAGVRKSALVTRVIVAAVLAVLAAVVVACLSSDTAGAAPGSAAAGATPGGVLQAAGLLFFAFAGYARIATLGEEVRDPARTIPRAVPVALGIALAVYAAVALSVLGVLGPGGLAEATAPLAETVAAAGVPWLVPVVRAGAVVAALGSLLALILGISRTTLAMARDGRLPRTLSAVHPRTGVPHHAEVAVGALVAVVAATADLRGAIGFSSFGVLAYYAVANAAAWTLGTPVARITAGCGLLGCAALAFSLPAASVAGGAGTLAAGAVVYALVRSRERRRGTRG